MHHRSRLQEFRPDVGSAKVDVVLLGSGGETVSRKSRLYNSEVVGRPHIGIHEDVLARSGALPRDGAAKSCRFPIDFEERPWIKLVAGRSVWKSWPYLVRALPFEGLELCLTDDAAVWRTIGLRIQNGKGLDSFLTRWCPEPDFGRLHGAEIKRLPNLTCVMHATVVTLETQEGRISSVLTKTLSGNMLGVRARRVVFCVGAIETPRLLLQKLKDGRAYPGLILGATSEFFRPSSCNLCGYSPAQTWHDSATLRPYLSSKDEVSAAHHVECSAPACLRSLNAGGTVLLRRNILTP